MATCLFAQDFIASGYSLVIGQSLATAFIMILLVGQFASCAGLDLWVAAAGREKKREGGGGEVRDRRGQVGGGKGVALRVVFPYFVRSPYTFL